MEVAILSTSWKLVREITEIVDRLDQTREDARSLKYLGTQAKTFLSTVTNGFAGLDPSAYRKTIALLELLYQDILAVSEEYIVDGESEQTRNATETRRNILKLNRRMKVFVNTYLLHGSIETAQLNLQAFVEPPPPPPHMSATSEKAMWKVMSWPNGATTGNQTSSNPPRVVSNPASPVFTPPSPTASALVTRVDNMTSSYAGSESNSRPSTPPLSIASPGPSLVLPPAYESLPPISDSDTPSRQHSTDRTTRRIGEYSDTRSDRNLNNRQLQAPTSSLASHDQGHIRRSDHSSSTQSGDMDTSMQFSNGISQHLSDPTNSPSRFQRPLPPTPASAGSTTPRRPDFVLRLQALRDCKYAGAVHNGWLRYKKSEILYTDGKKFNVIYGPRNKVSHTAVMAQNSHGNCGLVDPGKTFSEGLFSASRPYLRYLD